MRPQWLLVLGALVGAHAQGLVKRQDSDESSSDAAEPSTTKGGDESSSSASSSSSAAQPSSTGGGDDDRDTTTTRTVTVTNNDVDVVTRGTTSTTTITTTVVVTSTETATTTKTEEGEVQTEVVYETVTATVQKRGLDLAMRTLPIEEAVATAVPYTSVPDDWVAPRAAQDPHQLGKRATITRETTVTADGDGDASTVFTTAVRTLVTTKKEETTITTTRTRTIKPNAKSTVTETSTVTTTTTLVASGISTSDPAPTGGADGGSNSDENNNDNKGGDDKKDEGLSTGAKAGIGAGAGIAGLILISIIAWYFWRRSRDPKPDHDDLMGASEVPVGGPVGSSHSGPSMAHHNAAAAFLAPGRTQTKASHSPEGYRGTAMGDGRAGFAKPAPYGSAYTSAPSSTSPTTAYSQPTDYDYSGPTDRNSSLVSPASPDGLPEHPMPPSAEMDSRPGVGHHNGPTYEMSGQQYR